MDRAQRTEWARRIRPERELAGLTQGELAKAVDISRRQLGKIERGEEVPQPATLNRLLRHLGLVTHDPLVDSDLEALMSLLRSLVRRLPPDYRAEWAERMTEDLVAAIRESAHAGGRDDRDEETQMREAVAELEQYEDDTVRPARRK